MPWSHMPRLFGLRPPYWCPTFKRCVTMSSMWFEWTQAFSIFGFLHRKKRKNEVFKAGFRKRLARICLSTVRPSLVKHVRSGDVVPSCAEEGIKIIEMASDLNEPQRDTGFDRRNRKRSTHVWTPEEDAKLIEAMLELKDKGAFNNTEGKGFKSGYQKELEKMLEEKLPNHGLKEKPHIESRCKTLKKQYHSIYDVRHNEGSGFGWDDEKKCVTATVDVWDNYLKSHPDASFMRGRSFPYYDDLAIIWGKDRANGKAAEAPGDILEDLEREESNNGTNMKNGGGLDDIDTDIDLTQRHVIHSEGSSRQPRRKRFRSVDGLVSGLEQIGDVMKSHLKDNREQMAQIIATFAAPDRHQIDNRLKLNDELKKIEGLSCDERHKVGFLLVRDSSLLDFFFTIEADEKESWVKHLLRSTS